MPAELRDDIVVGTGVLDVEDATTIAEWFDEGRVRSVDLALATHLHGAVLQILLRGRPALLAPPGDPVLAQLVSALAVAHI